MSPCCEKCRPDLHSLTKEQWKNPSPFGGLSFPVYDIKSEGVELPVPRSSAVGTGSPIFGALVLGLRSSY